MSNIRSPISKNSDNYSHAQQNYGNIRVENSSNNDFQFRLNYLEKHFNLVILSLLSLTPQLEQRINIVEESQEKSKYSGVTSSPFSNPQGADFNTSERIKLLEELILRQKVPLSSQLTLRLILTRE